MSNLPQIKAEEKPPVLRFVRLAEEDRYASEDTGRTEYKDVVKVYVRAAGDNKCEVPFIAKDVQYDVRKVVKEVGAVHTKRGVDPKTGQSVDVEIPVTEKVEEEVRTRVTIHPWIDQLRDKLKNGFITEDYFDYCKRALDRFMQSETAEINGVPLSDWRGVTEAMKKKAIDLGILSVEDVAEMTEDAMQAIGVGAREMKRKAKAWLDANDAPQVAAQRMINLEEDNEAMREQLAEMHALLKAQAEAQPKRGRPSKKDETQEQEAA